MSCGIFRGEAFLFIFRLVTGVRMRAGHECLSFGTFESRTDGSILSRKNRRTAAVDGAAYDSVVRLRLQLFLPCDE